MFRLLEATIDDIHAALRAGEITSRQLVELYINRIEAYDHAGRGLNAIQTVNERALADAARLDAQFARSGPVGPLHGIPVLVKDQVETRELPTTYGSALFQGFVSGRDATAVERLQVAGAVILAKTTMGEFASGFVGSAYGICRNPYDPERDEAPVVRLGRGRGRELWRRRHRRGYLRLDPQPGLPQQPRRLAAHAAAGQPLRHDARYAQPGHPRPHRPHGARPGACYWTSWPADDPRDPVTAASVGHVPPTYTAFLNPDGLRGVRLGVIREPLADDTDPTTDDYAQVRAAIDRTLSELAAGGAEIVDPVTLPDLQTLLRRAGRSFEAQAAIASYLAAHPAAPVKTVREIVLSPEVIPSRRARFLDDLGHTTSDPGDLQQQRARAELRQAILTAMADHGLQARLRQFRSRPRSDIPADVLTIARRITSRGANRALASYTAYPAISVPARQARGLARGHRVPRPALLRDTLLQIAYA